jgi:hypothetical protein
MPATRDQVRRPKIVDHTVDFGEGVTITFSFDANKMTDGWIADWTRLEDESNAPQMNEMLEDLIERWDILETEGGPVIPVSAEEIGKLFSLPDKLRLFKEFVGLPSDAEGNASRNTSSSPNDASSSMPVSRPNGQSMSPTPEPSASPSLTPPT